jgi:kumamolisin
VVIDNAASREELVELPGSHRKLPGNVGTLRDAPEDDQVKVTLGLRRRNEPPEGERIAREEFAARYGADPADVEQVTQFAQRNGLRVTEANLAMRFVWVEGTVGALQRAFGVRLQAAEGVGGDGVPLRLREGPVMIPVGLHGVITGVFGLDNRRQAARRAGVPRNTVTPLDTPTTLTGNELATIYNFFPGLNGSGQTIGIIELAGGYLASDMNQYFANIGLAMPAITDVLVDGAKNDPGNQAPRTDAQGEVTFDIEVAAGVAPGAKFAVYFTQNTNQGFLDAVAAAIHDATNKPTILSISWGNPEADFTATVMESMEQLFTDAAALGISVFVAAGDNGSSDGVTTDSLAHVDFPASCPHATACGGTRVYLDDSRTAIMYEYVWDDDADGQRTGGGVSDQFDLPSWQQSAGVPPSANPGGRIGRGVPDVAGPASPFPGFRFCVRGEFIPGWGTSGVAPMWAGLTAQMNQALGRELGFLNPLIYQPAVARSGFRDITTGSNGAYTAAPGWDACTGLGSPIGSALLAALGGPYASAWLLAATTPELGNVNHGPLVWAGYFTSEAQSTVLLYSPADMNWLVGSFTGNEVLFEIVGNTAEFGQVGDGRPFWVGDFDSIGRFQIMFYFPADNNWWLGTIGDNGQLTWQHAGNTAQFGRLNDGRPFWGGAFSPASYRDQLMFYSPADSNWWLGSVVNGQLTWQFAGNTAGFGALADGRPFWTGFFAGIPQEQIMFYSPGDHNWWLGTIGGNGQLAWQLVGNTVEFGPMAGSPFWTGDFAGVGYTQIMWFSPDTQLWWLGTITNNKLTWQNVAHTGFGQIGDGRPTWAGDFTGAGHSQILFYSPADDNWWLGTIGDNGQLAWPLVGNTARFGNLADGRRFWTGDFTGAGHNQIMFYDSSDNNWWLGTIWSPGHPVLSHTRLALVPKLGIHGRTPF